MTTLTLLTSLLACTTLASAPIDRAAAESWAPAQATGAPDCPDAGDHATAWATAEADRGIEWLTLTYAKPMKVAQVRIHENFNPGAVSRVAAVVAGEEVILWEGTEPIRPAPAVFSVEALEVVTADTIKVYLDTRRVSGWNEIDAVELVATSGASQFAAGATASSSYAWGTGAGDELAELVGQRVTITVAGRKLTGRVESVTAEFIRLEGKVRTLVARSAIQVIEW
jgi:hypothetical protein